MQDAARYHWTATSVTNIFVSKTARLRVLIWGTEPRRFAPGIDADISLGWDSAEKTPFHLVLRAANHLVSTDETTSSVAGQVSHFNDSDSDSWNAQVAPIPPYRTESFTDLTVR